MLVIVKKFFEAINWFYGNRSLTKRAMEKLMANSMLLKVLHKIVITSSPNKENLLTIFGYL